MMLPKPRALTTSCGLALLLATMVGLSWLQTPLEESLDDTATHTRHTAPQAQPDTRHLGAAPERVSAPDEANQRTPGGLRWRQEEALVRGATLPVAADHVVVRLALDEAKSIQALDEIGAQILYRSPFTRKVRVSVPSGWQPGSFSQHLLDLGLASDAHPDPLCTATKKKKSRYKPGKNIPLYDLQWHHVGIKSDKMWEDAAHQTYAGGAVVAILDTGIAYEDHSDASGTWSRAPDLAEVVFHDGYDFVNGDPHANDDHQHGTHIATAIAGRGGALGVIYGVDLMPIKVLDNNKVGTESALIDGIHHATLHGADVINMSLSFPRAYMPGHDLEEAINAAQSQGITLIAAAGNEGEDYVAYPAAFPYVLAVGAVRMKKAGKKVEYVPAEYSNHGPALDIMAPGGDIDLDEDKDGFPDGILSQTFAQNRPREFGYWFVSGTSIATAMVTAVAAALHAEGLDALETRQRLLKNTHNLEGGRHIRFSPEVGMGLLNADKAARSQPYTEPPHCGVNTVVLVSEDRHGVPRAEALVEAIDDKGEPLHDVDIHAEWFGDVSGAVECTTDRHGSCILTSPEQPGAQVFGLAVRGIEDKDGLIHRAFGFARMDLMSYRLLASLATGLSTSEAAIIYTPDALADFEAITRETVHPTVTLKHVGTGLASSSIVLGIRYSHFMASPLSQRYAILSTSGTGLASSSLVWDRTFFNPSVLSGYDPTEILIWSFPSGTGLASSSIVLGDSLYPLDFWQQALNPAIVAFSRGTGLASSSIILDLSLWNPTLFEGTPRLGHQYFGRGTGLASSSFIFNFSPVTVEWLGFDPGAFNFGRGTGLASSSFVYNNAVELRARTTWDMAAFRPLAMSRETRAAGVGCEKYAP